MALTGCQSNDSAEVDEFPTSVSHRGGMVAGGISFILPRKDPWVPKGRYVIINGQKLWVPESRDSVKKNSAFGPVRGRDTVNQMARYSSVHNFEVKNEPLENALTRLRGMSSAWAGTFGYQPLYFSTRYSLKSQPVTLTTQNSSIHSICQLLADQVGGELEYRHGMIYISGCPYQAEY